MIMLTKKSVLLAETEVTYGTDPTPSISTDAILAIDAQIKEITTPVERLVQHNHLSIRPSLLGQRYAEMTFKIELQGSGTAGTAPRLGRLIEACACSDTNVPATSDTFAPLSASPESVTLYLYKDGRLHKVTGAVGTFIFTAEAGQQAIYDFKFQGLYNAPTVTSLPTPSYETTTPPVCKNQTFSFNSKTTLVVQTLTLDIGNEIALRPSLSGTDAVQGFIVSSRKPTFSINPEAQFETSYDFRTDTLTNQRQISCTIGSICTLTIPKANITNVEYSSRDGVEIETVSGECAMNSGNDEFTFAFTG